MQPIYDVDLDPSIKDHAKYNEEVDLSIGNHTIEIIEIIFEDFIWESWGDTFSISTQTNLLHLHCLLSLAMRSSYYFSPSTMKFILVSTIHDKIPHAIHNSSYKDCSIRVNP